MRRAPAAVLVAALSVAGCAVGPSLRRPPPPAADGYVAPPAPSPAASPTPGATDDQALIPGAAVPARWWTAFSSPALDALEDEALRRNPDVASAAAALRAARQTYLSQRGALLPNVEANAQAQRQKTSNVLQSPLNDNSETFNLYTAGLTAGYTLDLFGGVRRGVEGARAQAEQQRFQTEAAYLTVTTNVAATAIALAGANRQIAVVDRVIAADRRFLAVVLEQQRLGAASGADVAAAQLAAAQAEAGRAALVKQQAQARDLLAALVGRYPADRFVAPDLAALRLPASLPLSLPSALADQRPDIRAAEANLHYASAQVGVAIAARLPNFTISASGGGTSTVLRTLLTPGNTFWSIAGGLLQPIFDGGTLRHRQRAAEATLDQAKAQYRSTVLAAMQNVADVVQAIGTDAAGARGADAADAAADRALRIARDQARLGQISGASTLALEAAWLQAEQNRAQADAQRLTDCVLLFQALGGGWWNRAPAPPAS